MRVPPASPGPTKQPGTTCSAHIHAPETGHLTHIRRLETVPYSKVSRCKGAGFSGRRGRVPVPLNNTVPLC